MASEQRYPLVSPIGRIVEGDPWTPREKDGDGNIRVYKTGPNAGKPNPQYYIGLAIPKWVPHPQTGQMVDNPDFAAFYGQIDHIARTSWPNLFPNGGQCIAADFSWKIRDGDGFVKKGKNAGKPLAYRPGFAGHWIVSFSSSFAPSIVVETSPGQYAEITDPKLLQRGYWARIGTSVSSNGSTNTPGLYVNLEKIQLMGKGEVIQSGESAAETFGAAPAAYVPQGMQALTPMDLAGAPTGLGAPPAGAPAFGGAPAGFPAPQPGPAFGGAPVPNAAAPAPGFSAPGAMPSGGSPLPAFGAGPAFGQPAPGAGAGPVAGGLPHGGPAGAPAPAPAVPNAPAYSGFMATGPVMLPAANGATYEQFKAQGWTDEAMVASGYMAAR